MPPMIHIERMMHRNTVSVKGESAASYALVKLIPSGGGGNRTLNLNVALALDVSGSMYEEDGTGVNRLKRVQQAALRALDKLRPSDRLAIIAFAQNAQVVLPSTPISDRQKIQDVINRIDMFDVDPGGTSMDEGMRLAIEEIDKNSGPEWLNQVVVLTDGETAGEQRCRQLAEQMRDQQFHLTLMGVGSEWNASLIKDLARLNGSDGRWHYIDSEDAESAEKAFLEEFGHLAAATFINTEMHIRPVKDVRVKRCRLVVPEIKELPLNEVEERHLVASLGTLEHDQPTRYILDLSLPNRPDGNYVIAQIEVTYEVGGKQASTGTVQLQVQYNQAAPGYINAEVAKHIDEVQIYELNNNLQQAIVTNDVSEIQRLASTIEKKGELMGPRAAKKTMLARQALNELNAGGRVSKKTQLALADSARLAEEMPVG